MLLCLKREVKVLAGYIYIFGILSLDLASSASTLAPTPANNDSFASSRGNNPCVRACWEEAGGADLHFGLRHLHLRFATSAGTST